MIGKILLLMAPNKIEKLIIYIVQYTIQPPTGAFVQVLLYLLCKSNTEKEVQEDENGNFNDNIKEKNFLEWQKHGHNAEKK